MHKISQVSHMLTVFSNSINFYIYMAKHGKRELKEATILLANFWSNKVIEINNFLLI
jgi:hypothetical protein